MALAKRILKIFGAVVLILGLGISVLIFWINHLDCSRYTPQLSGLLAKYSSWEAKKFEGCQVHVGLVPSFVAQRVQLQQRDAKSPMEQVAFEHAEVSMRLLPLIFRQQFVIEKARMNGALLGMRITEPTEEVSPRSVDTLLKLLSSTYVQDAEIRDVKLVYRGEDPDKPFIARIDAMSLKAKSETDPLLITSDGAVMDWPYTLKGEAGSLSLFADKKTDYPIEAKLSLAEQELQAKGKFDLRAAKESIDITLAGPGLQAFSAFSERDLSRVPAYKAQLHLRHLGPEQIFEFSRMSLTLGRSHAYGEARLSLDRPRPYLSAQLGASLIRAEDVLSFLPPAPSKKEEKKAEEAKKNDPVFSREKISAEMLKLFDASVKVAVADYTGTAAGQLIDGAKLEATLKNGRLELKPARISMAGGAIEGSFLLDGQKEPLHIASEIKVKNLDLERLFAPFVTRVPLFDLKPSEFIKGRIAGQIDLKTSGQSPHQLASHLDGKINLGIQEGQVMATVVEAFGFDLTEAVSSWFADNPMTELECAITSFEAKNGRLQSQAFLIGTGDTNIVGKGFVDLGAEDMDFVLQAYPKDFSIGAIRAPIYIKGPFRDINLNLGKSFWGKGAAAVALGALVAPLAAVIPLIELGQEKEGRCAQYMGRISSIEKASQKKL